MAEKKKDLVVTAPLVSLPGPDGRSVYLYRGASVEGFKADDVKRLQELGYVGDDEDLVPGVAAHPNA